MSEETNENGWYDYREAKWEIIAIVFKDFPTCHLINLIEGSSDHVIELTIQSKGFDLDEIDWYRTVKK